MSLKRMLSAFALVVVLAASGCSTKNVDNRPKTIKPSSPTPTSYPTSGYYKSDINHAGRRHKDLKHWTADEKKHLCKTKADHKPGEFYSTVDLLLAGDASADQMRVVVAYFCPDRQKPLERAIKQAKKD